MCPHHNYTALGPSAIASGVVSFLPFFARSFARVLFLANPFASAAATADPSPRHAKSMLYTSPCRNGRAISLFVVCMAASVSKLVCRGARHALGGVAGLDTPDELVAEEVEGVADEPESDRERTSGGVAQLCRLECMVLGLNVWTGEFAEVALVVFALVMRCERGRAVAIEEDEAARSEGGRFGLGRPLGLARRRGEDVGPGTNE